MFGSWYYNNYLELLKEENNIERFE